MMHTANSVVVMLLGFVPYHLHSEHYDITMKPLLTANYTLFEKTDTALVYRCNLPEVAEYMQIDRMLRDSIDVMQCTTFYRASHYLFHTLYEITIEADSPQQRWQYEEMIEALMQRQLIVADTMRVPLLWIAVENDSLQGRTHSGQNAVPISDIANSLWIYYKKPVLPAPGMDYQLAVGIVEDSLLYQEFRLREEEYQRVCRYLQREGGLSIREAPDQEAEIIVFDYPH